MEYRQPVRAAYLQSHLASFGWEECVVVKENINTLRQVSLLKGCLLVGADVQPLGRQVVLYGVIHALTERLRSVFVPYFRYVLDGAVAVLTGQPGDAAQPKKKRRKSKTVEPVGDVVSADAEVAQNTWLLRFRVCTFVTTYLAAVSLAGSRSFLVVLCTCKADS